MTLDRHTVRARQCTTTQQRSCQIRQR